MDIISIALVDFYKTLHHEMMPENTIKIYSGLTPRKSRIPGVDHVVAFGFQYFILEYLIGHFDAYFFDENEEYIIEEYSRHIPGNTDHIRALHRLGYLPIEIKALPEGTICPIRVPVMTITNTLPEFSWVTNYLETLISTMLWQPMTSATIAYEYKKLLTEWAIKTVGSPDFVTWQAHDFSMRGMSSVESAIASGMGHLISFTGTDNIPAIYGAEKYYNAEGLIGASVPASEHSIQCMHYDFETGSEDAYFNRLLKQFPTGIISVVSDGFDFWKVVTETLPKFKDQIMAREGKLVIRPDSGDPVDILCGKLDKWPGPHDSSNDWLGPDFDSKGRLKPGRPLKWYSPHPEPEDVGLIELLWGIFGGTTNDYGYKVLDSHIGAIYGDSITLDRARQICERLAQKGFASTNVVLGVGSYTYQYNTRDTLGFAIKATYGETMNGDTVVKKEIYKSPATDDGTKKSAKGLLSVRETVGAHGRSKPWLKEQCTEEEEKEGLLQTIFKDGVLTKHTTFDEIKQRLASYDVELQPAS